MNLNYLSWTAIALFSACGATGRLIKTQVGSVSQVLSAEVEGQGSPHRSFALEDVWRSRGETPAPVAVDRQTHRSLSGRNLSLRELDQEELIGLEAVQLEACPSSLPSPYECFALLHLGHTVVGPGVALVAQDLSGAVLNGRDLSGVDLSRSELDGASFRGASLQGARFVEADASGADFTKADLSAANLQDIYLRGADLKGARLAGADLSRSELSGANLAGVDLSETNLSRARARDLKACPSSLPPGYACEERTIRGPDIDSSL